MKLKNNTSLGYVEAEEGDGVVTDYVNNQHVRGRVQKQKSPTILCGGGGMEQE